MRLIIQYFAILRDQRGLEKETLETAAKTPSELYAELAQVHGFSLTQHSLKVAVNDDFAPWETVLQDGDRVVFIPPVAGG